MGRKSNISYEEKIKACEDYINGIDSALNIARRLGMSKHQILRWARRYRELGPESLLPKLKNKSYTHEFKVMVVEAYLAGEGSIEQLGIKYGVPSKETIRRWILKYNDHEELKDYDPRPEVYTKMAYRKQTTKEERLEIVNYCFKHNKDYKKTAEFYGVSYSQVYNWVKKYLDKGEDGLTDKRGRHKKESELTEIERYQRKVKMLEARVKEMEMREALLKKVQEIERRRSSPKQRMK